MKVYNLIKTKILFILPIWLLISCENVLSNKVFSNSVTDVVTKPEKYNNDNSFSIYGEVKESYSLLGKSYFILVDENNSINCIANNYSPTPNSKVTLNGKLEIAYRINDSSGLLFLVDEK